MDDDLYCLHVNAYYGNLCLVYMFVAHSKRLRHATEFSRGSGNNLVLDVLGGAQRGVAVHESDPAGIRTDVDWREVSIGSNDLHPRHGAAENLGSDLRDHGVRALADIRRAGVDDDTAIAIDL